MAGTQYQNIPIYGTGGKVVSYYSGASAPTEAQANALGGSLNQSSSSSSDSSSSSSSPGSGATGRYPTGYNANAAAGAQPDKTAAAETTYLDSTQPEDPAAITSRVQSEYASEIQAIENYYTQLEAQQQVANTNESGRARAMAASQGELGSDLGTAAENAQDKVNQDALASITAQEGNAVGAVYGTEASTIEGEITGEKSTRQTALASDVTFQSNQQSKAQSQLQAIAGANSLDSLSQTEYDSLYEASGFSTPEQFNQYYNAVRASVQSGGKTLGDSTSGVYQQQTDGSWKLIIPGSSNTIGDPTTGVWTKNADGTYTNVIPAAAKSAPAGSMIYDPSTGEVKTQGNKYITSGGILYSVNTQTNVATPLTANKIGWTATGSSADQEKAAIVSYVNSLSGVDVNATIKKIESDPTTYFKALGEASQAGYFTPVNLGGGGTTGTTANTSATDAADTAASNLQDAADNANAAATSQ